MRKYEDCLLFDPRDSGRRLQRKVRRRLEADDYDISMTHHGKILVNRYSCHWGCFEPQTETAVIIKFFRL